MKTVIEMAQQTLNRDRLGFWAAGMGDLEAFAALVRADERERIEHAAIGSVKAAILYEREACAKVADGYIGADPIAAAIRARGNACS